MSIKDCISSIVANKDIDLEVAQALERKIENFKAKNGLGDSADDVATLKAFSDQAKAKALAEARTAKQYLTLKQKISTPNTAGKVDPEGSLRAMLEYDYTGRFKYDNSAPADVATLARTYKGYFSKDLIGLMEKFRSKIPGGLDLKLSTRVRDVRDLVKGIYGEAIENAEIAAMAKTYSAASKSMIKYMRELGAPARFAENWVPQSWDRTLVKAAGEKEFIEQMVSSLDMSKTNGGFVDEAAFRAYLKETYDDIVTNGLSRAVRENTINVEEALGAGGGGLFRERSFQFKNADAFLAAHDKFGQGDLFENMIKQIDHASRELALIRTFGPNYTSTFTRLNHVGLEAQIKGEAKSRFWASNQNLFNFLTGNVNGDAPTTPSAIADALASIRIAKLGASLGSSLLSSVSDLGTTIAAAKLVGASIPKIMKNYVKLFVGNKAARLEAAAMGNVIDGIITNVGQVARSMAEQDVVRGSIFSGVREFATRGTEAVVRLGGLTRHTQAIKNAFEMAVNIEYGSYSHLSFKDIPKGAKRWLDTTGITESDWKVLRAAYDKEGGFIEPGKIADMNVLEKWLSSVNAATRIAVPEPSTLVHTILGGNLAKNTWYSELLKGITQMKSYVLSVGIIQSQLLRNNILLATKGSKLGHMVAYMASSVPLAMLGIQLKELAAGKNARDFSDPKLYAEASLQVSSLPGDLLQQFINASSPKDLVNYVGGTVPTLTASAMFHLYAANKGYMKGDEKAARANLARTIDDFKKALLPGQNLWYTKLATDRLVFDQLQKLVDPYAQQAYIRGQQRLRKRTGQEYWWEKGEVAPSSFPTISDKP